MVALKGKIFSSQFRGDYWKIIEEEGRMMLIEATYFCGRPRKCKDKRLRVCPFPQCNYKRNQFCLSKPHPFKKKNEISKIGFEFKVMKGEVIFADWTNQIVGSEPPTNTRGYVND